MPRTSDFRVASKELRLRYIPQLKRNFAFTLHVDQQADLIVAGTSARAMHSVVFGHAVAPG